MNDKRLTVGSRGSHPRTRGVYDCFEDFIYELRDAANVDVEISSLEEIGYETVRVRCRLKGG